MKRRMLDTNICIYIIKNKPLQILQRFKEFDPGELVLCSITVAELYYGVSKSIEREKNLKALENFLYPFDIVDFDAEAALVYGDIRTSLEKRGEVIGGLDMLIASCAMAKDMILVTNNTREFQRIEGLEIENWV